MNRWSDFPYIVLGVYGLAAFIGLPIMLLTDAKQRRQAQGKSGWFDKPTITKYTWRKLAAALVCLFGFTLMILGAVAETRGWAGAGGAGLLIGLIVASVGRGTWEVITEDEQHYRWNGGWRSDLFPPPFPRRRRTR